MLDFRVQGSKNNFVQLNNGIQCKIHLNPRNKKIKSESVTNHLKNSVINQSIFTNHELKNDPFNNPFFFKYILSKY